MVAAMTPPKTMASARANDVSVGRAHAEQHVAQHPGGAERPDRAEHHANRAEPQPAFQEMPDDGMARGSKRHADADFVGALLDGVRNQPVSAERGERHPCRAEQEQHHRREPEEDQRAGNLFGERPGIEDRQIAVERGNTRPRLADEHLDGRRAPGVEHHARAVGLQEWQVEVRPRRFVDARVLHIGSDADDRPPFAIGHPDPFVERVRGPAPEALRQRVVDDDDRCGLFVVAILERTAGDERDAQRAEVVGPDRIGHEGQVFASPMLVSVDR